MAGMEIQGIRIHGIDRMTLQEVDRQIEAGRRFVFYEFCISLIIATLRRPTGVYFLRADEIGFLRGLPYSLLSLLLGWWGLPWGFIYTPLAILTNMSGGRDTTPQIRALLQTEWATPAADTAS
jgi:hypothetical protein